MPGSRSLNPSSRMSSEGRDRFLIALSEFLGERPIAADPLSSLRISDPWHFEELLVSVLKNDDVCLSYERFCQLMLHCGRRLPSPSFYEYFFSDVESVEQFEDSVAKFRKKAMWLCGNFRYAYKLLNELDSDAFRATLRRTEPKSEDEFLKERKGLESAAAPSGSASGSGIEPIVVEDLHLLGYVSGKYLADLQFCLETVRALREGPARLDGLLEALGQQNQARISSILAELNLAFPAQGSNGLDEPHLSRLVDELTGRVQNLKARTKAAREIGLRNTARYLTAPTLDVYVATSMRAAEDYKEHHHFIASVFGHKLITPLKLTYFDPTLSHANSRVTKGLIECLMLRRASVTIYSAGKTDTLGKDSELAATLAQGKPVIVYVPPGEEDRAKLFSVDHPLGLQVDARTGVAHGVLVVRAPDQCARVLRKVLLRELTFRIQHDEEEENFELVEEETKCVVRVVSQDPLLTHTFWTFFHRSS